MSFDSVEEVDQFCATHAYELGFRVRRSTIQFRKDGKIVTNGHWVCASEDKRTETIPEGCRKCGKQPLTRFGCKAKFRVAHDQLIGRFFVTKFHSIHNHPLVPRNNAYLLKYNSDIAPSNKCALSLMSGADIRPGQ